LKNCILSTENYLHHQLSRPSPKSIQAKGHEFHNVRLIHTVKRPGACQP